MTTECTRCFVVREDFLFMVDGEKLQMCDHCRMKMKERRDRNGNQAKYDGDKKLCSHCVAYKPLEDYKQDHAQVELETCKACRDIGNQADKKRASSKYEADKARAKRLRDEIASDPSKMYKTAEDGTKLKICSRCPCYKPLDSFKSRRGVESKMCQVCRDNLLSRKNKA